MEDTRTDFEKEKSPYFARWDYTGSKLQRRFKSGPKKAIFRELLEKDILAAAEAGNESQVLLAVSEGASMSPSATKAVRATKWWLEWAEQQGQFAGPAALLKKCAWAYRCTRIRAQAMASLPWKLVDDKGKVIEEHAILDLLTEVNPEMNWSDLLDATESDLCTYARGFWLKLGDPIRFIQRLNPRTIQIIATKDGIQGFKQQLSDKEWAREEIIYFHNYNPENDVDGLAPLQVAQRAIEIEIAADDHLKDFFDNNAIPFHIMGFESHDINTLKRMRDEWDRQYKGSGKQHKTAFVGGKPDIKEMSYAPDKLALEIVRQEVRRQICAAYGCPPALVGAWEAANYGTLDIQRRSLYSETLEPEGKYLAGVINQELIWKIDPSVTFEFAFDLLPIYQEDEFRVAQRYAMLVDKGICDRAVAAEKLGLPEPKDEPKEQGDAFENVGNLSLRADLGKFRRKCVKNIKNGKPALYGREFESEVVPPYLMEFIKGKIENVGDADSINDIFERAEVWGRYP